MTDTLGTNPAEEYQRFTVPRVFDPLASNFLAIISPTRGARALDIACGTGVVTRRLASAIESSGTVIGYDINPGMLAVARAEPVPDGALIEWREGNATELPFADESFDLVVCQNGLQYLPDKTKALREMRRVLTKNGRLGIAVWGPLVQHKFHEALNSAYLRHIGTAALAGAFALGDAEILGALLRDAAFQCVTIAVTRVAAPVGTAEQMITSNLIGAAAAVAGFPKLTEAERSRLVGRIVADVEDVAGLLTVDGELTLPCEFLIATGVS